MANIHRKPTKSAKPKKQAKKASHKRSPTEGCTGIAMNKVILAWGKAQAAEEGRSFSYWLERLIAREKMNAEKVKG